MRDASGRHLISLPRTNWRWRPNERPVIHTRYTACATRVQIATRHHAEMEIGCACVIPLDNVRSLGYYIVARNT
jgi:hypothetical protein